MVGPAEERAMNAWLMSSAARPGPDPQLGEAWSGRLDEWLAEVLPGNAAQRNIQDWSFPTDDLRDDYLSTIHSRSDEDVVALLRLFLFPSCTFSFDRYGRHRETH